MSDSDDEHLDMDTAALEDIVQEPASPPAAAVPAMHHLAQVRESLYKAILSVVNTVYAKYIALIAVQLIWSVCAQGIWLFHCSPCSMSLFAC